MTNTPLSTCCKREMHDMEYSCCGITKALCAGCHNLFKAEPSGKFSESMRSAPDEEQWPLLCKPFNGTIKKLTPEEVATMFPKVPSSDGLEEENEWKIGRYTVFLVNSRMCELDKDMIRQVCRQYAIEQIEKIKLFHEGFDRVLPNGTGVGVHYHPVACGACDAVDELEQAKADLINKLTKPSNETN